jgi:phosphohistidine phosphatase
MESLDEQRSLSPLGRDQVNQVARLALAQQAQAAVIFHSGILRAEQTAAIFAQHLKPPQGIKPISGLLPQDDPAPAAAFLATAPAPIMLAGHLPFMNRLASLLVSGDPDHCVVNFTPATLVCCARQGLRWIVKWILAPSPATSS